MKLHPVLALGFLASASSAFAATVPYSDAFQSGSTAGWTTGGVAPATWSIVDIDAGAGVNNVYQAAGTNTAGSFSSVQQLTNIGTGVGDLQDFTITTNFNVSDLSNGAFVGIATFGNLAALTTTYYLADINASGAVRIISQGGTNTGFTSSTAATLPGGVFTTARSFTMTFKGTYVGSTLNMSFTVTDGASNTQTVTASDTSPLIGEYFGVRMNNSVTSNSLAVQFSDFSVTAIPEPASAAALAGLGILGAVATMRRRRAA